MFGARDLFAWEPALPAHTQPWNLEPGSGSPPVTRRSALVTGFGRRYWPVVTLAIIGANVVVFLLLTFRGQLDESRHAFGFR